VTGKVRTGESDTAVRDDAGPATPRDRSRRRRRTAGEAQPAARRQIVDAAITTILELGFYRASSNEIARQANVSWGSIQYHFGTREGLLLAVVEELNDRFTTLVRRACITGDTLEDRLRCLYGILATQYGAPTYLARLQLILNLSHDPDTSADVAGALARQADVAGDEIRRLLRDVLGDEVGQAAMNTVFNAMRGTALSHQITDTLLSQRDAPRTKAGFDDELRILVTGLAAAARLDPGSKP
jgi:AcrR family transcriptional regulator